MAAIASAPAIAADRPFVTIYLQDCQVTNTDVLFQARLVAAEVYRGIGITLAWRTGTPGHDPPRGETVLLRFETETPKELSLSLDAFGYALPPLKSIHVIYPRVAADMSYRTMVTRLAYVLAHGVGHVLEGFPRHSSEGIMKAHWGIDDYTKMANRRLTFALTDIELIQAHFRGVWEAESTSPAPALFE